MAASPASGDATTTRCASYLALLAGGAPATHFLELRYRVGDAPARSTSSTASTTTTRSIRRDPVSVVRVRTSTSAALRGRVGAATKDAIAQVWTLWAECDGEEAVAPPAPVPSAAGADHRVRLRPELPRLLAARRAARRRAGRARTSGSRTRSGPTPTASTLAASCARRGPGTTSTTPPRRSAVLRLDAELRFTLEEVARATARGRATTIVRRRWDAPGAREPDDPLLAIPPRVYVADLLGRPPGREPQGPCPFHEDKRAEPARLSDRRRAAGAASRAAAAARSTTSPPASGGLKRRGSRIRRDSFAPSGPLRP